jgi:hypothetical protein
MNDLYYKGQTTAILDSYPLVKAWFHRCSEQKGLKEIHGEAFQGFATHISGLYTANTA